jgi:predicted AlkP superfamily pyrophosphatase or phosphodiesterase
MKLGISLRLFAFVFVLCVAASSAFSQAQSFAKPKPHVVVIGVNGMELDVIRPLILQGKMPNLASIIKKGAYGKLRTVSSPNRPRVYSTMFTSPRPEEHRVSGFVVGHSQHQHA